MIKINPMLSRAGMAYFKVSQPAIPSIPGQSQWTNKKYISPLLGKQEFRLGCYVRFWEGEYIIERTTIS